LASLSVCLASILRLPRKNISRLDLLCSPLLSSSLLFLRHSHAPTLTHTHIQYSTIQYITIQYNTKQYNTIQYTIQHIQHSTFLDPAMSNTIMILPPALNSHFILSQSPSYHHPLLTSSHLLSCHLLSSPLLSSLHLTSSHLLTSSYLSSPHLTSSAFEIQIQTKVETDL
jgi:hypothetical protein